MLESFMDYGSWSLIVVFLLWFLAKKRFSDVMTSNVNLLLSEILEIGFRVNSLSGVSETISVTLRRFYSIDYATILVFHERSSKLVVASSNVEQQYVSDIEDYCNTFVSKERKLTSRLDVLRGHITEYSSAEERAIRFSGFTPLIWEGTLIGGVLIENKDNSGDRPLTKRDFLYGRLFKAISLVLRNALYTENLISSASTDQLTNLYNRRFIDTTLEEQLVSHRIVGKPFTVVLLDIDYFKTYNDTYGHQVGDFILKGISNFLVSKLQGDDEWVARYGGEEFLMFFGRRDCSEVCDRVDNIRKDLSRLTLCEGAVISNITASFGIASYPESGDTVEEILEKVDSALYKSKENGRNLVTVYGESS